MPNPLDALGQEVDDAEQEAFVAFATAGSSRDLGMVDARASTFDVSVAGRDLTLTQSPGLLHSTRAGGTTGAVVWRTALALAEWLAGAGNPLFAHSILHSDSTVVELGAGINPAVALALYGRVARVVVTDQDYVMRLFKLNLDENLRSVSTSKPSQGRRKASRSSASSTRVDTCTLDWEADDIQRQRPWHDASAFPDDSADAVMACDCIYNENIVRPFVQTCQAICRLRAAGRAPTVCVVAQQLREPDVFELWLREMLIHGFRVWRVSDDGQSQVLSDKAGFVVHAAVLRAALESEA